MTSRASKLAVALVAAAVGEWNSVFTLPETPSVGDSAKCQTVLATLRKALSAYFEVTGTYPSTEQGLAALATRPALGPKPKTWRKVLEFEITKDPWGNPLVYKSPGDRHPESCDLYSVGKDGKPGTQDDLWPN